MGSSSLRKTPRLFVAGLFHEANSFTPGQLGLESFQVRHGADLLRSQGDGSPLGAFLEEAQRRSWKVIPGSDYRSTPGPIASDSVVADFFGHLCPALQQAISDGLDGVVLILHGSMVSESDLDVEGTVLAAVRQICRETPIFCVLDLHANVSPAMASGANILLAYRENPHTDAAETAVRLCSLINTVFQDGIRPNIHLVQTPILWPPTGTGSADEPMATLLGMARAAEVNGILAVNVCPGFAHSDTPEAGLSFTLVYDPSRCLEEELLAVGDALLHQAISQAAAGCPKEWNLEDAVCDALEKGEFPSLIVEPADNIGGGAAGDATWVLRKFLEHRAQGSGVILTDGAAVARLAGAEPGRLVEVEVGGWSSELAGGRLHVAGRLCKRTDGRFEVEDRHSHLVSIQGVSIEMGASVLIECDGILILLTSRPTPPFDLAQWRSVGVDPAALRLINVKAAVAHRRAYDPIAQRSYTVSTAGPSTSDLQLLPYRHLRRPRFPLDPISSF